MAKINLLNEFSLYIHLPWCVKRCPYCDFNAHKKPDIMPEQEYIEALKADIQQAKSLVLNKKLTSIFFGGLHMMNEFFADANRDGDMADMSEEDEVIDEEAFADFFNQQIDGLLEKRFERFDRSIDEFADSLNSLNDALTAVSQKVKAEHEKRALGEELSAQSESITFGSEEEEGSPQCEDQANNCDVEIESTVTMQTSQSYPTLSPYKVYHGEELPQVATKFSHPRCNANTKNGIYHRKARESMNHQANNNGLKFDRTEVGLRVRGRKGWSLKK